MSFSMTTRRAGWRHIKLGQIHYGIKQGQGLKAGEKVCVLGAFIPVSSRWEPLQRLLDDPTYGRREVVLEGFPDLSAEEFVDMLCKKNHCAPAKEFNRIEFKYQTRRPAGEVDKPPKSS